MSTDPMTTPPLDLPALAGIAKAATEGEWTVGLNGQGEAVYANWENEYGEYAKQVADVGGDLPDARHIAAFDPPTTLALLDRLEAAERDLAAVTVSRDGWQTRAEAAEAALQRVREVIGPWEGRAPGYAKRIRIALDGTA